jgi:hypothetical protein
MDRKLDLRLEKLARAGVPAPTAGDALSRRIADLEERVANIEGKLDITWTFEPN